jgi:DNA polymerase I
MPPKLLVLVDGSSYLYRAFHALPSLTSSKGEPTGAIHGVTAMLRRIIKEQKPDYIAVVFDAKGKTFRDDLYAEYKAHRPPMPQELRVQIDPLHEVIEALGIPLITISGVEADDVIGSLACCASRAGVNTLISSSDKDLAQLVNAQVSLANTMDNTVLDPDGIRSKFGVPPERIVDYLALVGDKVDNVPGVPMVGPKTAAGWLQEYGDLDRLIEQAATIKGKAGSNLRDNLPQLALSRQLVTVVCDLDLPVELADLVPRPPNLETLKQLFTRLEFKTWLGELLSAQSDPAAPEAGPTGTHSNYEIILTQTALDAWLQRLKAAEVFAFDTETTSLDYIEARIVGVSFAVEPGFAAYVPLAHDYDDAPVQLDREQVLATLQPLLEDPQHAKLGHNLKYDQSILANHGIELRGIKYDSMLDSYVLDSTASRHDMDSLALKYLGIRTIHFEDVAGKGAKQVTFNRVVIEQAGPYAAEDADVCLRLHQHLWPRLLAEPGLKQLYETIEVPLVPVLSRIERNGVRIDTEMLRRQSGELAERLAALEEEAHILAGGPFNMSSPKQIQEILFNRLGLPVTEKTPTGQPSTAESALEQLAGQYPMPRLILDHRGLSKLKSTYTEKLPLQVNSHTGRVHTSYQQAVAATGRLSSTDPNLQNIPIRTAEGRKIRQAFIAAPGYRLLAADYSQIELRIMAHLSGDAGLLDAFASGADVHKSTAAEVFGKSLETVSTEERRAAKAINFGLIYGMSAFGLARQLGIDRGAAQKYVDLYFARYPGVKTYMDQIRATARAQGYVETVFSRRLHLPEINSKNMQRRQYAERTAINAPMQGTAADIIKRAMIDLDAWLQHSRVDARLIMQVHDELVLEVAKAELDTVSKQVNIIMTQAADLRVPLVVDIGVGDNWDEAH